MSVTLEDIRNAATLIEGAVVRTPCLLSGPLSALTGAEMWLKFENLQFTSSFKDRGALVKLLSLTDTEREAGVIAMSAGNHAQGVAYHARRLGIPATIVMPLGTPNVKMRRTEAFGAKVRLHGETVDDAAEYARKLQKQQGFAFISPFDDEKIIAGQGTVSLEMLADAPGLECLIVPIGGGGLISGMAIAAKALNSEIKVIGVESELYPSMHAALAGTTIKFGGQTLADGIAVKVPGAITQPIVEDLVDEILLVSETEIERAIAIYLEQEKTVVEGAGAVGLAAVLSNQRRFSGRTVGLVLTGGNIDTRLLASLLMRELLRDGRVVSMRVEIADRPGALAAVAKVIAESQANILEVTHQRTFLDVPAKRADLDIVIETRDGEHVRQVTANLERAGYSAEILDDLPTSN